MRESNGLPASLTGTAEGGTQSVAGTILRVRHLSLLNRLGGCHAPGCDQQRRGFVVPNYTTGTV